MSWEFEALFDVEDMGGLTEIERAAMEARGERWQEQQTAIPVGKMGYRTRTTKAGPRLEAEIYPLFGREATQEAKRQKRNLTPEKIQRNNDERARRKLINLIDANFGEGDLHVTLTYAEAPGWGRAKKDIRNFLERIKRLRAKRKLPELKYIYALEGDEEGQKKRIHAHVIMNGGIRREEIEAIWARGYANADRLQPTMEGLEAIARYISKQNREKHRRKWSSSKNLKKPQTRTSDTKLSNNRVKRLARGFDAEAKEVMEKIYPGYDFVRSQVRYSDVVDGVYIRVLMRKKE